MKKNFIIASATSIAALEDRVNELMEDGYMPSDNIVCHPSAAIANPSQTYLMPMMRYIKEDEVKLGDVKFSDHLLIDAEHF